MALAIRALHPDRDIIIGGDNDHQKEGRVDRWGNPLVNGGKKYAEEAALAVGGISVIPSFPKEAKGSDWNDYAREHGNAALVEPFAAALATLHTPKEKLMADAQVIERPNAQTQPSAHRWDTIIAQLKAAHAEGKLNAEDPRLVERLDRLLREVDGSPVTLDDPWFQTRVAYVIQDIDRLTRGHFVLPPALRSEIDRLAVSSPGLQHEGLEQMLRDVSQLGHGEAQLIHDVRHQAHLQAQFGDKDVDGLRRTNIEELGGRVMALMGQHEPPPHTEVPPNVAAETIGVIPPKSQPQAAPTPPPVAQNPPPAAQPPAAPPMQSNNIQPGPGQMVTGTVQTTQGAKILSAIAPSPNASPPPWSSVQQGLAQRLQDYAASRADRYTNDMIQRTEQSATAAVKALEGIKTGAAAGRDAKDRRCGSDRPKRRGRGD